MLVHTYAYIYEPILTARQHSLLCRALY